MLVLVVGSSGVGKDTLLAGAREALDDDERFRFVRREITRPADDGAEDHEPVDPESFTLRLAAGAYSLWWAAHGLRYALPSDIVLDLDAGRVVVANVSRAVIARAAARFPVQLVEISAPVALVARRLAARGRETEADIAERLARRMDIPACVTVHHVVNDADPATGVARLVAVLLRLAEATGERARPIA